MKLSQLRGSTVEDRPCHQLSRKCFSFTVIADFVPQPLRKWTSRSSASVKVIGLAPVGGLALGNLPLHHLAANSCSVMFFSSSQTAQLSDHLRFSSGTRSFR